MDLNKEQQKAIALAKARKRKSEVVQETPISPQVQSISSAFDSEDLLLEADKRFKSNIARGIPEAEALNISIRPPITTEGQKEFVKGVLPAAATIASGIVAEPVAGLAGIGASLVPGLDEGVGSRTVESVRSALTLPTTDSGESVLGAVGEALDPTLGALGRGAKAAGDFTLGATDSPLAATAVETAISAIPELAGIKGARGIAAARRIANGNRSLFDPSTGLPSQPFKKALDNRGLDFGSIIDDGSNIPVIFGNKTPAQVVDDIIAKKIKAGDTTDALFNLKLGPKNSIIRDSLGDEALRQGFLKGDITAAKTAGSASKREMRKMLRIKRSIQADSSKALDVRPSNVVGDNTMERFKFIRNRANSLRKELDLIASRGPSGGKKLLESDATGGFLKGREIDPSRVADTYFDGLDDLGVKFDTTTTPPKLNFSSSAISEDRTSQRIIKSVTNILAKGGDIDAAKAHGLKRQLDTMLDFNKKSSAGLTDAGKKFTGDIRRAMNESIRDVSPRYARINDELSKSLKAMESFDKALGGIDAFADNANVSVGQTLRRLLGNAQSKANLDTALTNLDDVARDLGGSFDVDVRRLIQFNKTLDDRFGATARGSLQGEIESSLRSGPVNSAKEFAFKKAAGKVEELRGINDPNAFNVMEEILKSPVK